MIKKKKEFVWRIKDFNNKTRKGKYFYLKSPSKKGAYYKERKDIPFDVYYQHYEIKPIEGEKKPRFQTYAKAFRDEKYRKVSVSPRLKRKLDSVSRAIKKRPSMKESIQSGITSTVLPNAELATQGVVRQTYKNLLAPLVQHKKLLDIMTLDENIQRLRTNFEHRVKLYNEQGQAITIITIIGTKSLTEIVSEIQSKFRRGMTVEELSNGIKRITGFKPVWEKMKGNLDRVEVEIIFRR